MLESFNPGDSIRIKERTKKEFISLFQTYINEQLNLPENIQKIRAGIARFNIQAPDCIDSMEETSEASVTNYIKITFNNLSQMFTKKEIKNWALVENESLHIEKVYGNLDDQIFSDLIPLKAQGYKLILILGCDADWSTDLIPTDDIQNVLNSGTFSFK